MPPRPLRPKDEPETPQGLDDAPEPKSSKRRAVSSACIPCRKRKSKCDGALPSCSTCTAVYRTECSYDADSDHRRKGALKRDLQSLQQQNDALDVIVASLRSLPEGEAVSLLHSLRSDTNDDVIAASLRSNVRLPHSYAPQTLEADFAQQLTQTPNGSGTDIDEEMHALKREPSIQSVYSASSTQAESPAVWFRSPQDAELVEHLLNLYFCWAHPIYPLFSRDHFLHDMSRGRSDFCSAMLVNAILAFACHYSDRPQARTDPTSPSTSGDHFFSDAKKLLEKADRPSLTTVQALGVMSIRETSLGRDSNGYQYAGRCVRMALELGLHLSVIGNGFRATEAEVRKITFWGIFNLETMFSVGVGRLSQLPKCATDIPRPQIRNGADEQLWRPYDDSNLTSMPSAEQPARPALFLEYLSRLSEISGDVVNAFYAPHERFTSRRLASTYAQYQEWHRNLPDCFRVENTTLPHVLALHMYYYDSVLHLFRPYIKLDLSGSNLYPRDTCTFCANEISSIMNTLRAMYGLRRVNLAVVNRLMSSLTIHLLNLPSEPSASHLVQGLQDLQAMSLNHQFASRCIEIITSLAAKWNIALPDAGGSFPPRNKGSGRQFPSPPSNSFWAASIPRKQSDHSTRSGGSSSSHRGSPSMPPPSQAPQSQGQDGFPSFYEDSGPSLDLTQNHGAFWTPFPLQNAPVPPQNVVPSMPMDIAPVDSPSGHHWPSAFNAPLGTAVSHPQHQQHQHQQHQPQQNQNPQQSLQGMMDGIAFQGWQWQN